MFKLDYITVVAYKLMERFQFMCLIFFLFCQFLLLLLYDALVMRRNCILFIITKSTAAWAMLLRILTDWQFSESLSR